MYKHIVFDFNMPAIFQFHTIIKVARFLWVIVFFGWSSVYAKEPLDYTASRFWQTIKDPQISTQGRWLTYIIRPQQGENILVARNVDTDQEYRFPRCESAQLTYGESHVVFLITPRQNDLRARGGQAKRKGRALKDLGILDLATGQIDTIENVLKFAVPRTGNAFVAYLAYRFYKNQSVPGETTPKISKAGKGGRAGEVRSEKRDDRKMSLLVWRNLKKGNRDSVWNVQTFSFTPSKNWLIYTRSSQENPENTGIFALHCLTGRSQAVLKGKGDYTQVTVDEKGEQVVFLSNRNTIDTAESVYALYHWDFKADSAAELISKQTVKQFPDKMVISKYARPGFSKDGNMIFLGLAPTQTKISNARDKEKVFPEVWHYLDVDLPPVQAWKKAVQKKQSYKTAWHLDKKRLMVLADENVPHVHVFSADGRWALGYTDLPYRIQKDWEVEWKDIYLIDTWTGNRELVLEKHPYGVSASPGGRYLIYFDRDYEWHLYDIKTGCYTNLTSNLAVRFEQETWDMPTFPHPYGLGGWTAGDTHVLIYDRYDVWKVSADGKSKVCITDSIGRNAGLVFRYHELDRTRRYVPTDRPILLRTIDERTGAMGYYSDRVNGAIFPKKLMMLDKAIGKVIKAKERDRIFYTRSSFSVFPNIWVDNLAFSNPRQITDVNPQQSSYLWGTETLINWTSEKGTPQKGILFKPENFDPQQKYPMLVYVYENLSKDFHKYWVPAPDHRPNPTIYTSNGYLVFHPDIIYREGHPVESALECVTSGVRYLAEQGVVDTQRVGISGHSWGGYLVAALITRTQLFKAAQAGAPITDLISSYGSLQDYTGTSRAIQYESTQGRIGGNLWKYSDRFIDNSPVFRADQVETPILMLHNKRDRVVPWAQSIEYFLGLRRLGKAAYLICYPDEGHRLKKWDNRMDWAIKVKHFFDHHLAGGSPQKWMASGGGSGVN